MLSDNDRFFFCIFLYQRSHFVVDLSEYMHEPVYVWDDRMDHYEMVRCREGESAFQLRLRLVRMARLTSLLRAFPEAMMLLKGEDGRSMSHGLTNLVRFPAPEKLTEPEAKFRLRSGRFHSLQANAHSENSRLAGHHRSMRCGCIRHRGLVTVHANPPCR